MTTPIRKRTHIEMNLPEAPATPSALTDTKTHGVAMPVVTETPTKRTPRTPRNYSSNTEPTLPVTPSTLPQTPNRKARGNSQHAYQTPESKRNIAAPAKPSKKHKKTESDEDFAKRCYGEKPVTVEFSRQIKETIEFLRPHLPNSSLPEYYKLPSGRHVLAIQQPNPDTSSCGPGCALMIATDHQKVKSAFGDQKFRQWYAENEITNARNMRNAFQILQISCKLFQFTTDKDYSLSEEDAKYYNLNLSKNSKDAIQFMKNMINSTKCSLMTAITHPNLAGHWVIIDEFNQGYVYGRCPRFGIAFCVSETKLAEWLFDQEDDPEIVQSMITFPS